MNSNTTARKLTGGIIAAIILTLCLCITTAALVMAIVSVENNQFFTGKVEINLNDGKPVISQHEFLFEPGMTVEKDFFVQNESSDAVYYRLYFENIAGGLKDVLHITVKDGDTTLYSGTPAALTQEHTVADEKPLAIGEQRNLTIVFHLPVSTGNTVQNADLQFDLCAEAVQMRNNPGKTFS